uniref:Uncharacterized protein n=1 Tax=Helicotheca tamesis TaxID=374047 RepID=A0A7S2MMZ8_9STRA|mmetsp:Transcript_18692/g.25762  ORF Transcript_18692/g.25762 Transcript_18692/m.25762 type:complete len:245 (+) Transcript_18692:56-790(+)|eukprot:CAMPEP_0185729962 /NCGR_PEP_ID=MMETSP1171-20130828/7845_1 /TAXON_ID=374046 /ORGANISM="Helicotheca tamensis, Strain CCMP826" /LENGTH=244 /DNA_ID=CAMNT_0028398915 /DNA_START=45 /DNA_END=779 /DNA_ORIENTATION=+
MEGTKDSCGDLTAKLGSYNAHEVKSVASDSTAPYMPRLTSNKDKTFSFAGRKVAFVPQHLAFHELYLPEKPTITRIPINYIYTNGGFDHDECCHIYADRKEKKSRKQQQQNHQKEVPIVSRKKMHSLRSLLSRLKKALGKKGAPENIPSVRRNSPRVGNSSSPPDTTVKFHGEVTVFSLPSPTDYPSDVWSDLYLSEEDLELNMKRNRKEFDYDFRDWMNATEEEDMILSTQTGELMHPVHIAC